MPARDVVLAGTGLQGTDQLSRACTHDVPNTFLHGKSTGGSICTKGYMVLGLMWCRNSLLGSPQHFVPWWIHDHRCRSQARPNICKASSSIPQPKIPTRYRSTLAPGFPASLFELGLHFCCPMKPSECVRRLSQQKPAVTCELAPILIGSKSPSTSVENVDVHAVHLT